jgi:S-DNA-T family DNA segregation ATPase FtsK/SpoIIIE
MAGAVADALDGHGADLAGLTLVLVGLVAGLGVYADLAGPFGRALDTAAGALAGLGRFLVPLALVAGGVALVKDGPEDGGNRARAAVGSVLVGLAALGLAHLAAGPTGWGGPVDDLRGAGGLLGALVAEPLRGVVATWGAALVLLTAAVLGLVVLTRVPVRVAARRTAEGVRPLSAAVGRAWRGLFTMGHDGPAPSPEPPSFEGPDEADEPAPDDDDGPEPTAEPAAELAAAAPAAPEPAEPVDGDQLEIDLGPGAARGAWKLPPLTLLARAGAQEVDRRQVEETGRALEAALAEHGVATRLVGMLVGPTVTRYELELGPGVKVARVTSLHKDIAYAMASPDVRILAPIPGRQAIGVEVPNVRRQIVTVGDILSSEEARRATHPLEVAIGRDISGRAVLANLATMPHLLIAGATGAGKSSCINSLITSILMRSTPEQVRMILVDPKRVELNQYDRLPHLLTSVVTNPKKAANALSWAVREMERRYDLLSEVGVRDITGYNAAFDRGDLRPEPGSDVTYSRLPFVLVVVDELNDLMMVAARDVEESICRIAQMARAVGIHLVVATQRPSVNVITGVIKANIPARLAFAVSSLADSRVILDRGGAERLVGKGDMLLLGPASSTPRRVQGAWVTEDEVRRVVAHWRRQSPEVAYVEGVEGEEAGPGIGLGGASGDEDDEALVLAAMDLVVRSQLGSTSMLQRKLRVGFARAGRLMDLLEQRGVVGPSEGSKARAVLMTVDELEELQARARER